MDDYTKAHLLSMPKRLFAQHALLLIKANNIPALLSILGLILNHPTQQKALAPIYPRLARLIRKNWTQIRTYPLRATINHVLNQISVNYINHIGCDCKKQIDALYLTDEIVRHMSCTNFVKNIMLHLPLEVRKKYIFYLDSSYHSLLKKQHKKKFNIIENLTK